MAFSHWTIPTGKVCGVRMDTLMRMQSAYEIAQTRKREKLIRVGRLHIAA